MNKRMVSLLIILCISLILSSMLISCEDPKKKQPVSGKDKISIQEESRIKLGVRYDSNSRYKYIFNDIAMETNEGYKFRIDHTVLQSQYDAFLGNLLSYEKASAMLQTCDAINTAGNFNKMASDGLLMDITDLLPVYAPNYYAKLTQEELEQVTYNGRIYGVPPHMPGLGRYCIMVRKDIADKYNVSEIKNLDDYESLLAKIKKNESGCCPIYYEPLTMWHLNNDFFMDASGYINPTGITDIIFKQDDPDMALIPWERTEEFDNIAKTIIRWDKRGYISLSSTIENSGTVPTILYCAVIDSLVWSIRQWNVYPLYPEKTSFKYPSFENVIGISSKSQKAKDVLRFIEWVHSSQENYNLFMYGIKDEDYVLDDGRIKRMPKRHNGDPSFWDIDYMMDEYTFSSNFMKQVRSISELNERVSPTYGLDLSDIIETYDPYDKDSRGNLLSSLRTGKYAYMAYSMESINNKTNTGELTRALQDEIFEWRKRNGRSGDSE